LLILTIGGKILSNTKRAIGGKHYAHPKWRRKLNEAQRKQFGDYLRGLRAAMQMTQKDAALQAGLSAPYLAQLERGQRNPPSRKVLARFAEVYQTPPQELWREAQYADSGTKNPMQGLSAQRVQWAFETACRDPEFSYGTRLRGQQLTLEAKAFIVQLYQKTTKRQLLTDDEQQEMIIDDTDSNPEADSNVE